MKWILLTLLTMTLFSSSIDWLYDFEKAKAKAQQQKQPILVVFSGSDWCKPCIRFDEQVINSTIFKDYATKELTLLKVDFPRKNKNKLSKSQQAHNNQLAEKYNPRGEFPLVLLLDKNGKVLKRLNTDVASPDDFLAAFK